MTTEARIGDAGASRSRARALSVAATVAVALAVWFVVTVIAGADLRAPAFGGRAGSQDVGAIQVLFTSALAALAGWAALSVLERTTGRARVVWLIGAVTAFLVSLSGPFSGAGVDASDRLLLALLHATVAVVLIPSMYRTSDAVDARGER